MTQVVEACSPNPGSMADDSMQELRWDAEALGADAVVVYLCLSSSSDDHPTVSHLFGTGMRFGTENKFCHHRASLVHLVSLVAS